jgi:hypothetical protein
LHLTVFRHLPFDLGFVKIIACFSHESPNILDSEILPPRRKVAKFVNK